MKRVQFSPSQLIFFRSSWWWSCRPSWRSNFGFFLWKLFWLSFGYFRLTTCCFLGLHWNWSYFLSFFQILIVCFHSFYDLICCIIHTCRKSWCLRNISGPWLLFFNFFLQLFLNLICSFFILSSLQLRLHKTLFHTSHQRLLISLTRFL